MGGGIILQNIVKKWNVRVWQLRTGIPKKVWNFRSSLLLASEGEPCSLAIGGATPFCFQSRKDWPYLAAALSYTPRVLTCSQRNVDGTNGASSGLWMVLWNVALRDLN